jgi:hypothetical protein
MRSPAFTRRAACPSLLLARRRAGAPSNVQWHGGEGGIRTPGTELIRPTVFETAAFNRTQPPLRKVFSLIFWKNASINCLDSSAMKPDMTSG